MILSTGGLDLKLKFLPVAGTDLVISTNIYARELWKTTARETCSLKIGLEVVVVLGVNYYNLVITNLIGAGEIEKAHCSLGVKAGVGNLFPLDLRIFYIDKYMAVTCNGKWLYFYGYGSTQYVNLQPSIVLSSVGGDLDVTDVVVSELKDGRQAIYVDYESTAESAIQSIIQQRPIQMNPNAGRSISLTYRTERTLVSSRFIRSYSEEVTDPGTMASDALVYYANIGVSVSALTAQEVGFITKLYRLSELNTGALEAAATMQLMAIESRNMITVSQRFDPRIEVMDVLDIDAIVVGTGRHVVDRIIITGISFGMENGEYTMNISGRRKKYG